MNTRSHIILSLLKDGGKMSLQLLSDFLESGYQSRKRTMSYIWGQNTWSRTSANTNQDDKKRLRKNYHNCIIYLEKSGMITTHNHQKNKFVKITNRGSQLLEKIDTDNKFIGTKIYQQKQSNSKIIIIFDIPEKMRDKRNWFREIITYLGFRMIQKSVWMGDVLIPRKLIDDLKDMNILHYIDFFEVKKYRTEKSK